MPHLIWNKSALCDLRRCYNFLAMKNPAAASRAVQSIREGIKIVIDHPGAGRMVDKMDASFREWIIRFGDGGYIVRYRLRGGQIIVVAVKHQREGRSQS